jgi:hypothetical protein
MTMAETFDKYCADVDSLEAARALVEQALGIAFALHESMYWGGEYYLATTPPFDRIAVRSNFNSFTQELTEPSDPACRYLVSVDAPDDPDLLRRRLEPAGLRFLRRAVVEARSRSTKVIEVDAKDAAAHGLAAIGFRVDTADTHLFGRPFSVPDHYLALSGAPGSVLAFRVAPSNEPESDAGAVERAIHRWFGNHPMRGLTLLQPSTIVIAGRPRSAMAFAMGEGRGGKSWCATIVGAPAGALLISFGHGGAEKPRTCEEIAQHRYLGKLVQSFELL